MKRVDSLHWRAAHTPVRRRDLLLAALAGGVLGAAQFGALIRSALAAEPRAVQGVREVQGEVRVNDRVVGPGDPVRAGDRIETGAGSRAVIVLGADALLLRDNTRIETTAEKLVVGALRVLTGKLLAVFGPGRKSIETTTATIGIRGTGAYFEAEPERTYFCLCYGTAQLDAGTRSEAIRTRHHESPRYITRDRQGAIDIEPASAINHSDYELIMLEALVGREPPFLRGGAATPRY